MPKATITFNLPEEREDFETAVHANTWKSLVYDLDQSVLRQIIKYDSTISEEKLEVYEHIRDELYRLLGENGLSIY